MTREFMLETLGAVLYRRMRRGTYGDGSPRHVYLGRSPGQKGAQTLPEFDKSADALARVVRKLTPEQREKVRDAAETWFPAPSLVFAERLLELAEIVARVLLEEDPGND